MDLKFGTTFLCWLYNQLLYNQQLRLQQIWKTPILKTNKQSGLGNYNSMKFYISFLPSFALFEIWKMEDFFY